MKDLILSFPPRDAHKPGEDPTYDVLNREVLQALTGIYFAIIDIDFETWRMYPISLPKSVMSYMVAPNLDYRRIIPIYCRASVSEPYQATVRDFMDPETVVARLSEYGIITMEYIGTTLGWCKLILIPSKVADDGRVLHAVCAVQNINEEKRFEQKMTYLVEHDPLTKTMNRAAFNRIALYLKQASFAVAFLMIDINDFKAINDTYGHGTGDMILKRVAKLLLQAFRASDYVIRMGGDEFAVLLTECSPSRGKAAIGEKIAAINKTLRTPEAGLPAVSISAGVAFSQVGYYDALYAQADAALYDAKAAGDLAYVVYHKK